SPATSGTRSWHTAPTETGVSSVDSGFGGGGERETSERPPCRCRHPGNRGPRSPWTATVDIPATVAGRYGRIAAGGQNASFGVKRRADSYQGGEERPRFFSQVTPCRAGRLPPGAALCFDTLAGPVRS